MTRQYPEHHVGRAQVRHFGTQTDDLPSSTSTRRGRGICDVQLTGSNPTKLPDPIPQLLSEPQLPVHSPHPHPFYTQPGPVYPPPYFHQQQNFTHYGPAYPPGVFPYQVQYHTQPGPGYPPPYPHHNQDRGSVHAPYLHPDAHPYHYQHQARPVNPSIQDYHRPSIQSAWGPPAPLPRAHSDTARHHVGPQTQPDNQAVVSPAQMADMLSVFIRTHSRPTPLHPRPEEQLRTREQIEMEQAMLEQGYVPAWK